MAKPNETYTEEEQKRNRLRSIDIREANAPQKFVKALADQGYGCKNGLEDTTIPIKTAKRSGLGMNQRATEECSQKNRFGGGTTHNKCLISRSMEGKTEDTKYRCYFR